jgi:hypothetical protein
MRNRILTVMGLMLAAGTAWADTVPQIPIPKPIWERHVEKIPAAQAQSAQSAPVYVPQVPVPRVHHIVMPPVPKVQE